MWTTTPWTIPVNQAIAYGPEVEYSAIFRRGGISTRLVASRLLELSQGAKRSRPSRTRSEAWSTGATSPAPSPATRCTISAASSPSRARSCPATSSPPTAAPASSTWRPTMARTISSCARRHGIDPVFAVEADGNYREDWLWLGGQGSVINPKFNAPDGPICSDLREAGAARAARTSSTAIRIQLAVEGQGHLPLHPAMVHRHGQAAAAAGRRLRRAALGQ